jgi:hypothetical protein
VTSNTRKLAIVDISICPSSELGMMLSSRFPFNIADIVCKCSLSWKLGESWGTVHIDSGVQLLPACHWVFWLSEKGHNSVSADKMRTCLNWIPQKPYQIKFPQVSAFFSLSSEKEVLKLIALQQPETISFVRAWNDFEVGTRVDASQNDNWYPATIKAVQFNDVLVLRDGVENTVANYIKFHIHCERLAKLGTHTYL